MFARIYIYKKMPLEIECIGSLMHPFLLGSVVGSHRFQNPFANKKAYIIYNYMQNVRTNTGRKEKKMVSVL